MGNRGIDRDHQIKICFERRRIGEISQVIAEMKDIAPSPMSNLQSVSLKDIAAVGERGRIVGPQCESAIITVERRLEPFQLLQSIAAVEECFRVVMRLCAISSFAFPVRPAAPSFPRRG